MKNEDNICISCGQECNDGHRYCFYCFFRNMRGTARFLLFKAMKENGNKPVTLNEAWELDCKLRAKLGKRTVSNSAVANILFRYSQFYDELKEQGNNKLYLIIKGKRKQKGTKKLTTFKLSSRLLRRVAKNEEDWRLGFPVYSRFEMVDTKFQITDEYALKAKLIAQKIRDEDYPLYENLLSI